MFFLEKPAISESLAIPRVSGKHSPYSAATVKIAHVLIHSIQTTTGGTVQIQSLSIRMSTAAIYLDGCKVCSQAN